jgi:hypothetical protein
MGYAMVEARVMGFRVTRFTVTEVMQGSKQYSRSFAYRLKSKGDVFEDLERVKLSRLLSS